MDVTKGFWGGLDYVPVGGGELDYDFYKHAQQIRALLDGATAYSRYLRRRPLEGHEKVREGLLAALPGGTLVRMDYYSNNGNERFCLLWPDSVVDVNFDSRDELVTFNIASLNHEFITKAIAVAKDLSTDRKPAGSAFMMTATKHGITLHSIGMGGLDFEASNYSAEGQEGFEYIVENLKAKEPSGRMVILDGIPGAGKTFFVRSLMGAVPTGKFIIVPSNLVSNLASPDLLSVLLNAKDNDEGESLVLVIEDCDECLRPREGENNMPEMATLLNITDGIIGSSLNIFVIATTNAKDYQIDGALKRPGRLLKRIHFEALPPAQAAEVFKRLTGNDKEFDKATSVATVYQLAKDAGWKPEGDEKKVPPLGFRMESNNDARSQLEIDLDLPAGSLDEDDDD